LPPQVARSLDRRAGIAVAEVVEGSPAARAGLRRGDLILDVDGVAVHDASDLQRLMGTDAINRPIAMRLWRAGTIAHAMATPVEMTG
jgi:S1-C subfamily serine protease